MSKVKINIDGKEIVAHKGQMLADVAKENGIHIPTLCHDERVKEYGACGVCVVEGAHTPKLIRACSTEVFDGLIVNTNSPRIYSTRKAALELLLSDHRGDCRPPCVLACPGQTDCQGYVGLVSMGQFDEAVKLVKDVIPLPGSIGRVCPHPCEDACRREMVEEPIAIANIKSFLGDKDMENGVLFTPPVGEDTGKKVAVIGGGPGGITAAYFLRIQGHAVEIFDKMPQMGGMLYYGIPEYRLPKDYLTAEVNAVRDMGAVFHNNVEIGKDRSLESLREEFDAVVIATGAWTSTPLRCEGEELEGVVGGIDFLRHVVMGESQYVGKNIAIVGGGNTAMDACRTAVRLGANKVYNVYRRTKAEMPAEEIEIVEAEEEGVIFKELTNPLEVVGTDGRVSSMRLQIMELGEPDDSGRRRPVAVEGKEETIEVDTVIVAIGQKLDPAGMDDVALTDWKTISADEFTFATNLDGVFAVGDATNNGADIAISAIGEAKKAADVIDSYLNGGMIAFKEKYVVTEDVTPEMLSYHEKAAREIMALRNPENRKNNFLEINYGYTDEQAMAEGSRCLECGCHDYFECQLIETSNQYDVNPDKFMGDAHHRDVDNTHPFIHRNPDRCILCGLCVRVCTEVIGETALGLVGRGFDTTVSPALELPLGESGCISCGQCVALCPTGALLENIQAPKQVPTTEHSVITTCGFCSVGCQQELTYIGSQTLRALPYNDDKEDALLCVKGRFGFGEIDGQPRIYEATLKADSEEIGLRQSGIYTGKRIQALQSVYGKDSIAVSIGNRYTNEEAFAIKEYANNVLGTENVFSFGETTSGVGHILGKDGSTATFKEMENTDLVLMVEMDIYEPHLIAGLSVKRAKENGAKLIVLNKDKSEADQYADKTYITFDNLGLIKSVLKTVLDESENAKEVEGYDQLVESLKDFEPCKEGQAIAKEYLAAKNAVIIFEQSRINPQAAEILAQIALVSGKAFKARNGIIQLKPGANSQGLADIGVKPVDEINLEGIKGLVIFGENPPAEMLPDVEFLAVHEIHMTETAAKADIVLPARGYTEISGTFTNSEGKVSAVTEAVVSPVDYGTVEMLAEFATTLEHTLPWENLQQVAGDWVAYMSRLDRQQEQLKAVEDVPTLHRAHPVTNQLAIDVLSRL